MPAWFHRNFLLRDPQGNLIFLPCLFRQAHPNQRAHFTAGLPRNTNGSAQIHQGLIEIPGTCNILPCFYQLRNFFFHLGGKNVVFHIINACKHPEYVAVHRGFPLAVRHAEDSAGGIVADAFQFAYLLCLSVCVSLPWFPAPCRRNAP